MWGLDTAAAKEAMLTTVPCSAEIMAGRNSDQPEIGQYIHIEGTCNGSSIVERIGATLATPALLKRSVGPPRLVRMAAAVVDKALGEVMSQL